MDITGLPEPDAIQPLFEQLQEALLLDAKFQPSLVLPSTTQVSWFSNFITMKTQGHGVAKAGNL